MAFNALGVARAAAFLAFFIAAGGVMQLAG